MGLFQVYVLLNSTNTEPGQTHEVNNCSRLKFMNRFSGQSPTDPGLGNVTLLPIGDEEPNLAVNDELGIRICVGLSCGLIRLTNTHYYGKK